jgi:type I restriction enzyme, S subunit
MIWQTEPLGDLCEVEYGTRIVKKLSLGKVYPVYGGGGETFRADTTNRENRVVIARFALSKTCTRFVRGQFYLNDSGLTVSPKVDELSQNFLDKIILSLNDKIFELARGVGQANLDINRFLQLRISYPPLEEQKRIVTILNQAEELKQKRQRTLDLLEELKQSIFFDMFVAEERAEWPLKTISEISVNMRTGPFGSDLLHSEFVSEGISVLGIDNAVQNKFAWSKYRFITPQKYEKLKRYTVKPKDLLITIMGTVGRCAVVPDDIPISINTKHLCCISLDRDYVLPEFLHSAFLGHPEILRQLGMQTKGAVMPGLNMGIIKGLKVRLPPIDLQKKYAHKLNQLSLLELDMINSDQKLEELFSSIQYQAFSGELVGDS